MGFNSAFKGLIRSVTRQSVGNETSGTPCILVYL